MQLPPTILSINNKKITKRTSKSSKQPTKAKGATQTKAFMKQTSSPVAHHDSESSSDGSGFDNVLADVTSQVSIRGDKNLLVPPKTLETTLFDRLENMYGSGVKRMLDVQYR